MNHDLSEIRAQIISFYKTEYKKHGTIPSVAKTCKRLKLYRNKFYAAVKTITSICEEADLPVPISHFERISKASEGLLAKKENMRTSSERFVGLESEIETRLTSVQDAKEKQSLFDRARKAALEQARFSAGQQEIIANPKSFHAWLEAAFHGPEHRSPMLVELEKRCFGTNRIYEEYMYRLVPFSSYAEGKPFEHFVREYLELGLQHLRGKATRKALQTRFAEIVTKIQCRYCKLPFKFYEFQKDGTYKCDCEERRWALRCLTCKTRLQYDSTQDVHYCRTCGMTYQVPHIELSDEERENHAKKKEERLKHEAIQLGQNIKTIEQTRAAKAEVKRAFETARAKNRTEYMNCYKKFNDYRDQLETLSETVDLDAQSFMVQKITMLTKLRSTFPENFRKCKFTKDEMLRTML